MGLGFPQGCLGNFLGGWEMGPPGGNHGKSRLVKYYDSIWPDPFFLLEVSKSCRFESVKNSGQTVWLAELDNSKFAPETMPGPKRKLHLPTVSFRECFFFRMIGIQPMITGKILRFLGPLPAVWLAENHHFFVWKKGAWGMGIYTNWVGLVSQFGSDFSPQQFINGCWNGFRKRWDR